jgi:hypothetical protein
VTRTAARWSRKRERGRIGGSIRRFAPFRDMPADTGFEYVHRIGRLGSYFERKRG